MRCSRSYLPTHYHPVHIHRGREELIERRECEGEREGEEGAREEERRGIRETEGGEREAMD